MQRVIDARLFSLDSESYRRSNRTALEGFADWVRSTRGLTSVDDVDSQVCRRYAQHLRDRADDEDDISAATARSYYANARAWLGWCVRDGRIDTNPAKRQRAVEELPAEIKKPDTQFWSIEERKLLLSHFDDRVNDVLDDERADDHARMQAFRDRGLAYVLALAGVRIGEVLRSPPDPKRTGVAWADIDLEEGVMEVFGKIRDDEETAVPTEATKRLMRYRQILNPPTEQPLARRR